MKFNEKKCVEGTDRIELTVRQSANKWKKDFVLKQTHHRNVDIFNDMFVPLKGFSIKKKIRTIEDLYNIKSGF